MTIYQSSDFWTNHSSHSAHSDSSGAPSCCAGRNDIINDVISSNEYNPPPGPSLLEAMSVPHAVMTNATGINHVTSDTPVDLAHPHRGHEASLMSSGYPPVSLHPMPGFPTPSQVHFPGHGAPSDFLKPPPPLLETLSEFRMGVGGYGMGVGMGVPSLGVGVGGSALSHVESCKVCGDAASGIHFGALTCEGCKGFYKRNHKEGEKMLNLTCSRDQKCEINANSRNNCRFCRYKKCLDVGMSRESIKLGRRAKKDRVCLKKDIDKAHRVRAGFFFTGNLCATKSLPPLDAAIHAGYINPPAPPREPPILAPPSAGIQGSMHGTMTPNGSNLNSSYGGFFVPNLGSLSSMNYNSTEEQHEKIKMEMEFKVKNEFAERIVPPPPPLTNPAVSAVPSFPPIANAYPYARDPERRSSGLMLDSVGYQPSALLNMEHLRNSESTAAYRPEFMTENSESVNNQTNHMESVLNECMTTGYESSAVVSSGIGARHPVISGNYGNGSLYSYAHPTLGVNTSAHVHSNNNINTSTVAIHPPFNEFVENY